ncbi:MAG TPA: hypothetical protein VF533_17355 [Solirubrobacteraceae bacterium]|jgi:hypothetical protein
MLRRFSLLFLPTVLLLALAPAGASAALRVGISDSSPTMFSDPLFAPLQIKTTRLMVSWNALSKPGDDEQVRIAQYIDAATAKGIDVLVSFEHARGAAASCKKKNARRLPQCKLPSVNKYTKQFVKFHKRFPQITAFSPWNEINHQSQPTYKNPKRAAQFTNAVRKKCIGCTIVVADILDQADSAKRKRATFKSTAKYIKKFKRHLKGPRKLCGIHNYSDTNRFRMAGTKALIKALGCKQYWLTETGGIVKFAGFKYSTRRQQKATKYMFKIARKFKRIKRMYIHNYFGVGRTQRFDAGLTFNGKARPAYREVKKFTTR